MKRITGFVLAALSLALVTTNGNLAAQGMGEGGHGMTRMMAFSPHHLMMHGDALELTEAQRESLMRIQHAATETQEASKARHDEGHAAMLALFSGEVEPSAAREMFGAAHAAGGEAHWAMINAAIESMALLDEMQLARAHGWADMMEMMGKMSEGEHSMGEGGHDMGDDDGDDEGERGGMMRHR